MPPELPAGTVTILFTDVEGSTELTTRRGDEVAHDILGAQRDLVRQQVEEHSGYEVKSMGDGFMVVFGSARRAVSCAVAIQRALYAHNLRQAADDRAHVRMGLNTGEVIEEGQDLFGEAVNAAARVAAKAKGDQILVSDSVRAVMGRSGDVEFVDRGRFRLKGFPERWRLYEIAWREESRSSPIVPERTPFVAREEERSQLRRLLDGAARGQGGLVMIAGEPGVGKTRLMQELADEAPQLGFLVLTGHCHGTEGSPPYVALIEMLEEAVRRLAADAFREALGEGAQDVAKLMPELRRTFADISSPPHLPPEQERHLLFNSVREFFARLSRTQPLLLLIDDLQWADEAMLLLLQHLAPLFPEAHALILATYRDTELEGTALAKTLEELVRQRLVFRMKLQELTEPGVETMLQTLSGSRPPASFTRLIVSETEGNPFFIEEVFKHLAEEGKLFDSEGAWRSDVDMGETDVPASVRLVIGHRLERLSENGRFMLTAAAVIGRDFSYDLLGAICDLRGDALLDALDEAERAHMIVSTSERPEVRFTFAHELVRQTILAAVSGARRQTLHLRAAEAMEQAYLRVAEGQASDLAHHFFQAGTAAQPRRAIRYLILAADRAMSTVAFEEALSLYNRAVPLTADDRRSRAELFFGRGMALRSLGRWEEALSDWNEALALFEAMGDPEEVGRICGTVCQQLIWEARYLEALELSQRGLVSLRRRINPDRCILLAVGGVTLSLAGYFAPAERMILLAQSLAQELDDGELQGKVLTYKALHHLAYAQMPQLVDAGERAAHFLRSAGDLWELANALWLSQFGLAALARFDDAIKVGEELEGLASRVGHLGALAIARRVRGAREFMRSGDLDQYEAFSKADLDFCRSFGLPWISNSYSGLGLAYFWKGRWEEALELFEDAARLEPPGVFLGIDWSCLFLMKAYAGDRVGALAMLREKRRAMPSDLSAKRGLSLMLRLIAAGRFSHVGLRALWPMLRGGRSLRMEEYLPRPGRASTVGAVQMLATVVEGLAVLGLRHEVADLYPVGVDVMSATNAVTRFFLDRLTETVAGIGATAARRWDDAERHFSRAIQQADELPHRLEQPEVRRFYSRMLIERDGPGDRGKAVSLLNEAIEMYRQIGMPRHEEMAAAMLGEL